MSFVLENFTGNGLFINGKEFAKMLIDVGLQDIPQGV